VPSRTSGTRCARCRFSSARYRKTPQTRRPGLH
jgi:hypothetical protein